MKTSQTLFLACLLIFSANSLLSQDHESNMRLGLSIGYGEKPRHAQTIRYINPTREILPEVLAIFGDNYEKDGSLYTWKGIKVKGLSRRSVDVYLKHERYDLEEPLQGIVADESFSVSIMRKNREFLYELKFWNTSRLRKLFKPFEEPLYFK